MHQLQIRLIGYALNSKFLLHRWVQVKQQYWNTYFSGSQLLVKNLLDIRYILRSCLPSLCGGYNIYATDAQRLSCQNNKVTLQDGIDSVSS